MRQVTSGQMTCTMRAVRRAYLGSSAKPVQAGEIGGADAFSDAVEERDTVSEPETFQRMVFLYNTIQERS